MITVLLAITPILLFNVISLILLAKSQRAHREVAALQRQTDEELLQLSNAINAFIDKHLGY